MGSDGGGGVWPVWAATFRLVWTHFWAMGGRFRAAFWGAQQRSDGVCPLRSSEDKAGSLATAGFKGLSAIGFNHNAQSLEIHFLYRVIGQFECIANVNFDDLN